MDDNGFSRAQRSYDNQMPPDNTEDWEAYERLCDTPENKYALKTALFDRITDSLSKKEVADNGVAILSVIEKGLEHLDVDGLDKLFALYEIAPSFDSFCDDRRYDDGPDPDIGRDD